jgi:hypothetical protein
MKITRRKVSLAALYASASLVACGGSSSTDSDTPSGSPTPTPSPTPSPGPAPGPSPAPTPTPAPSPPANAAADWAARSAGAFHAQNFAAFTNAAEVHAFYNVGAMVGRLCPKNPSMGSTWTNAFELVTTAGHAGFGKAFRLWHGKNNYGSAGTIDNQWFTIPCNGDGTNIAAAYKTKLYVQFSVWVDSFVDYYWHLASNDMPYGGAKFVIIDNFDATATVGEFVITNDLNRGFITAYRDVSGGGSAPLVRSLATPVNNFNFAVNNAINNGTALTDQASYERRYGPVIYGMSGGTSQATRLRTQGVPDPDAAAGTVVWNRGGITTIECELDLANDRLRYWAAVYGQAPKLIGDTNLDNTNGNKAQVGSRIGSNGVGWSAMTLSNLIYTATGAANPNYPTDAYTDYSEIIFHPSPINFPGGHALPGL